jgi:CheY-like chemotaxis protein
MALRILLIEDDADSAAALATLLRLSGHEVSVAPDGPSALEQAGRAAPEVVLLDIGLPGLSGWEVAERLRALPGEKRPLLIALTGRGQPLDRIRSEQAGIDLHLLKGSDPQELLRALDQSPGPPRP